MQIVPATPYSPVFAAYFKSLIASREEAMRAVLAESAHVGEAAGAGVTDFKDLAGDGAAAAIDDARATHAMLELEQLAQVRRRLADHTYGICLDCGEAIDVARLEAMPASVCCAACQAAREQAAHR